MRTTNRLIERMRVRQAAAGAVTVRPMYGPRRPVLTVADRLAVVFDVCGVTDRDRQVIAARLSGASFLDVAAAVKVTRQRVQQIERATLARLGLAGSVESLVHTAERAGGADLAHGRAADADGLAVSRGPWVKLTRAELALERAAVAFLRSHGVTA